METSLIRISKNYRGYTVNYVFEIEVRNKLGRRFNYEKQVEIDVEFTKGQTISIDPFKSVEIEELAFNVDQNCWSVVLSGWRASSKKEFNSFVDKLNMAKWKN